jgi:S-layer protein
MAAATYANYTAAVGAVAGTVTFTKKVAEALTDITTAAYVVTNALTAGGAPAVGPATVTTQGVNPIVGSEGILALTNMASGGTLRTDATGSYNIGIKDASSGTADVANVLISSASAITTTIVAADVETINFTTTDTQTTGIVAHTDTLNLTASGAKTIVVTGNAGLTVTNNAANTKITSFDASGVTLYGDTSTDALKAVAETAAAVTFTSVAGASASVSIKGGAGADTLTGSAATDTIVGGAGNDTLNGMAGQDVLTGGAGNDIFVMSTLATSGVSYDTITDLTAGDIVRFGAALGNADANGSVAGNQLGAALSGLDAAVAVFQDYLDAAANKGANIVSWFQFGGNTYVVQDINGAQTFQNGADNVVKITGLVTLTNSTFTGTDLTIV